ncbi:AsmA family protein, partial [bacterium]|nr:AsmA family protein [bacterium]
KLTAYAKANVDNFALKDYKNLLAISNRNLHVGAIEYEGEVKANVENSGFVLSLPHIQSVVKDEKLSVDIDKDKIVIRPSGLIFNYNSKINLSGKIDNYLSKAKADIKADGKIDVNDLGILVGKVALPYYEYKGLIPVKASLNGTLEKMSALAQAKANASNYFTPVMMRDLVGLDTIFHIKLEKNKDTLKLVKGGICTKAAGGEFSDSLEKNILFGRDIVTLKAIISNLSFQPFISIFKLKIPHELAGSPVILKKTGFMLSGELFAYGKPNKPNIKGSFTVRNLIIPELYSKIEKIAVDLGSKTINFYADKINVNGSLLRLSGKTDWDILLDKKLYDIRLSSFYIDVNKILKVVDAINTVLPSPSEAVAQTPGKKMNIPLEILSGNVRLKKIVMDKIVVDNTTAEIALLKNIFYLRNLKAFPLGSYVSGKASADLIETLIKAEVSGKNFNIEKILADVLDMRDMLSGNMNFVADLSLQGKSLEEQLKTLNGTVDFNVKNGQLGPFGKLENFIMAENIRENAFFSSAIGSVVTNLVTFDTSRYNELYGHLDLHDGIAEAAPIKSQGDVMSMYIAGKVNLLDNTADLKVRGKLASAFSDKLGP